jgi:tetratricopeptide (TPR) repeat protein
MSSSERDEAAHIRLALQQAAVSRDAEAMLAAGVAAIQAELWGEAVRPVESVLRHHPHHPNLWQLLALLHRGLDDLAPSLEAFAKAAELAPRDALIAQGYASASFEAGLPALRLYDRALRLNPDEPTLVLARAAALVEEGRSGDAMAELQRRLRRTPGWLGGHAALAGLRWTLGDTEGFADSYERAVQAAPGDPELWRAYINTLVGAGLHERVLAAVDRARAAAGPQHAFDVGEAVALSELGRTQAAIAIFRRFGPLRELGTIIHYLRLLFRAGHVREATQIAENVAPLDPSRRAWPYLAMGWRLLGDPRWQWLEGDPRFIGVYDIAQSLPPLDALAERLRALHRRRQGPLEQSVRGGTQTEGHLFLRIEPEIQALRQAVAETVERHVAQLPPPQPSHPLLVERRGPIRFAGSWSVRLTGGGRHSEHVHPAGWLSSALYIKVPEEEERGGGEAGWLTLGEVSDLGAALPPIRTIDPKPGRLVLFPSTMWHGTRPFGAGERLTVAFDVRRP